MIVLYISTYISTQRTLHIQLFKITARRLPDCLWETKLRKIEIKDLQPGLSQSHLNIYLNNSTKCYCRYLNFNQIGLFMT